MAAQTTEPLPPGYRLGEYTIERKIGGGGFSCVYLATDHHGRAVAIKEYLPDGIVKRGDNGSVLPVSDDKLVSFRYGMKCFFDEGRALAGINHPNIVRVINFFRANGTVYMVMAYEHGQTLQAVISARQTPLEQNFICFVFIQVLGGLREVHAHRLLHLDIKPANIYLRRDGSPLLIDFGASRRILGHDLKHSSPMYTPGFAAPELYQARDCLGPWTDLYAIGATIYACLAGVPPPPADERLKEDRLTVAIESLAGRYSQALLTLVMSLLKLDYLERPQSVFSVQKRLIELMQQGNASRSDEI